jgi:hypothetical protein
MSLEVFVEVGAATMRSCDSVQLDRSKKSANMENISGAVLAVRDA